MENIAKQSFHLRKSLITISRIFREEVGPNYLANAAYMSASERNSGFSVAHDSDTHDDRQRSGKYLWRRKLTPSQSIGVKAHNANQASKGDSLMFAEHHENTQIPLFENNDNPEDRALLQIVFKKGAALSPKDAHAILIKYGLEHELKEKLKPLIDVAQEKRTAAFELAPPYKRNAIIVYPDINGFKKMAANPDREQAMNFGDKFMHNYLDEFSARFGANIVRYQGDGAWFWFPVNDRNLEQQVNLSLGMSKEIMQGFSKFAEDTDPQYADRTIKILAELEEVRTHFWNKAGKWVPKIDLSGPLFTTIETQMPKVKARDRHQMMIGPNLRMQIAEETDDFHVHIDDYRTLNFE